MKSFSKLQIKVLQAISEGCEDLLDNENSDSANVGNQ